MRKKMMGGGMMQRPMYKDGSKVKKLSKLSGLSKKEVESKLADKKSKSKNTVRLLPRPDRSKNLLPLKPKPRDPNKKPNTKIFDIIGDILKTPYKIRGGKAMGGRIKKKMGGSLKSVPAGNKGLKKLPTEVRNKMGFMKKGGVVSDTKKKQFKANQAGQKATNKKAMKVAQDATGLNLVVGAAEVGKKIARKFKGDK